MKNLLDALIFGTQQQNDHFSYQHWQFTRVFGGMNGITYRAENSDNSDVFAVKIRKRDERNRALREFSALHALEELSFAIAPKPISLHTNLASLSGDIIISSWVARRLLIVGGRKFLILWHPCIVLRQKMHRSSKMLSCRYGL